MKIDTAKLDLRLHSLKETAKRRNRMNDSDLAEYLHWSAATLRTMDCQRKLHTMRVSDMVALEALAGEQLVTKGLERR